MIHTFSRRLKFTTASLVIAFSFALVCSAQTEKARWKKHVITQQGHCYTAVALDANGDKSRGLLSPEQAIPRKEVRENGGRF